MDVSRIDPEEALVDAETVEAGDVSADMIDESLLQGLQDYGQEDKVLVSIRCVTSYHASYQSIQMN